MVLSMLKLVQNGLSDRIQHEPYTHDDHGAALVAKPPHTLPGQAGVVDIRTSGRRRARVLEPSAPHVDVIEVAAVRI